MDIGRINPYTLNLYTLSPFVRQLQKPKLVLPEGGLHISSGSSLSLFQLLINFLKGGSNFENSFRAKELYEKISSDITILGGLDKVFFPHEVSSFTRVLNHLRELGHSPNLVINVSPLSKTHEKILVELVSRIEFAKELQEHESKSIADIKKSLDSVLDSVTDKIIGILLQEALTRGSYINLVLAVSRLNPIWEIPDEADITKFLKGKVLTQDFRNCLKDSIRGREVDKEKLTFLQKKFYYFAKSMIVILINMPDFAIRLLPRLGKVTKLSLNVIHHIPIAGPLINSFFGPVDEVIAVIGKNKDEIRILRNEAKKVRYFHKLLTNAKNFLSKVKDEGSGFIRQVLEHF